MPFQVYTTSSCGCCADLKWHLKHHQGAKSVRVQVVDWPRDDIQLQKLSDSLLQVSRNLLYIEELVSPSSSINWDLVCYESHRTTLHAQCLRC